MRKPRTSQLLAMATAAATIAGLSLTTNAQAVVSTPVSPESNQATDSRTGSFAKPTRAQVEAVAAIVKASPGTRATWDGRFGTPRTLTPALGETLSGPRSGSAVDVARAWLDDNLDMLGLSGAAIDSFQLRRDHVLPGTGTHVVDFVQTFDGVAAARGGSLGLAVRKDGSVLSYTGETIRTSDLVGSHSLSPAQALKGVASGLASGVTFNPDKTGTQAGYDVFARGPFAASSYVKKAAFPTADGARAAYSRALRQQARRRPAQVIVDAQTGKELYKPQPGAARGRAAPSTTTTRAPRRAASRDTCPSGPPPSPPAGTSTRPASPGPA